MESKTNNRTPIKKQISKMVIIITFSALFLAGLIGLFGMLNIRAKSIKTLTSKEEQDLMFTAINKATYVDGELNKIIDYATMLSEYAQNLYKNPNQYKSHPVFQPNPKNAGKYTLQRALASEEYNVANLKNEMDLLGNLEDIYKLVIKANKNMKMNIYAGTESGFLIGYDEDSSLNDNAGEEYYNYFESDWYKLAKENNKIIFTDVYADSMGRGLMISCASPFYNQANKFAGVFCLDIHIEHLYKAIIDVSILSSADALLIDGNGNAIISDSSQEVYNIYDDEDIDEDIRKSMKYRETGIKLSKNGIYYAYAPIKEMDWELCISISQKVVMQPIYEMNRHILFSIFLFFLMIAVSLFVILFQAKALAYSLTHPLEELTKDVKEISLGNLERKAQVFKNDEIGDVAKCVNSMSSSLKQYMENLTKVTADKERISTELNVATQIQADMLPSIYPAFPERTDFDLYATMTPAKEVGGDFYDFMMIDDNHLAILVGDVSGKGVPSSLFMVISKTLIASHCMQKLSPSQIFEQTNNELCKGNSSNMFVTCWLGIIDLTTLELTYVNAGHTFPILYHKKSFSYMENKPNFILAMMNNIEYQEYKVQLSKGDRLFLYTDGVTEAINSKEELFGENRLLSAMEGTEKSTAPESLDLIRAKINEFVGKAEQFDDLTMLQFILK